MRQINNNQFCKIFNVIEAILAKIVSLPVTVYNSMANQLVIRLVNITPTNYHSDLVNSLLQVMQSMFEEKKRGKQEQFKQRI